MSSKPPPVAAKITPNESTPNNDLVRHHHRLRIAENPAASSPPFQRLFALHTFACFFLWFSLLSLRLSFLSFLFFSFIFFSFFFQFFWEWFFPIIFLLSFRVWSWSWRAVVPAARCPERADRCPGVVKEAHAHARRWRVTKPCFQSKGLGSGPHPLPGRIRSKFH